MQAVAQDPCSLRAAGHADPPGRGLYRQGCQENGKGSVFKDAATGWEARDEKSAAEMVKDSEGVEQQLRELNTTRDERESAARPRRSAPSVSSCWRPRPLLLRSPTSRSSHAVWRARIQQLETTRTPPSARRRTGAGRGRWPVRHCRTRRNAAGRGSRLRSGWRGRQGCRADSTTTGTMVRSVSRFDGRRWSRRSRRSSSGLTGRLARRGW